MDWSGRRGLIQNGPMRRIPMLSPLLALALPLPALAAQPPAGYAQAADYLEKDSRPERYTPLNILDGRDTTVWCAPAGGKSPLSVGFKGVATVDEVRLYTGNGSDRQAFKAFARVKKLTLQGKESARTFTVEDKRGTQTVPLNPAISGAWFTLEVVDTFPGNEADAPVCLTDIVFYSEGKPLNGTFLAPKLKYDARTAPLLGTWYAGLEGAPDRFLSFYVDGTYQLVHEPLGGEAPTTLTGTYAASGARLTLDIPKKGKTALTLEPGETPADGHTLTLPGEQSGPWKEPFRTRP
ncbi:hypothetical protein SAMN05444354_1357 [Stigmatella aurantiaca]|uniref:NAD glycohydrolase translocation F5/8 type C domain-containing protein n=2 Tax=Stigmatella aurantiaca TaxID=41 RepID=A0A1H8EXE0_STIAU|nr:hypothetical protein SAMN05444354_1357 [Stigmatella aurantiaca]